MAGDLLARLRLAKYKVRTGQADVPFPQLEARVPKATASPARDMDNKGNGRGVVGEIRRRTGLPNAPRTGEHAIRGAAGLVRLAQGTLAQGA
ncbi:hypothetical protein IMZ48_07010 [Candidatus Bathyarchaeota archaeon]|nr:hypothetical protein [Candidatus Bathyarchaeota archaeon]